MDNELSQLQKTEDGITPNKISNKESLLALSILDAIIESTADGILVVDLKGNVIKANKRFAVLWRIPESLLETKNDEKMLEFILDQLKDPEKFIAKVKDLYSKPEEKSYDILEFKDGKYFERVSIPQKINNEIMGRVWSFKDITEHKRNEEKYNKERILLRTLIDNLPDGIYAKDIECRKTIANLADVRNIGLVKESEVLGKTDFELFPREEASAFYADDQTVITTGNPVIDREESFIDKEGIKNWLLTTKIPLRDSDGKIIGLIGIGRNITVKKKNELIREALYQISESTVITNIMFTLYARIHQVISNLMDAKNFCIVLYDEKEKMLTFPYMVDEYDPLITSKKFGKGLIEYVIKQGEPMLIDIQKNIALCKTGEVEPVGTPAAIWLGVPLKEEERTIGVIVVQDYENAKAYGSDEMQLLGFVSGQIAHTITRKRNAEAIEKYTAELKELNQTKDKFFSIIAHDLKSPFQGLLGYSQILTTEYATLPEEEKLFFINGIGELSQSAFRLLENLLEWSRMQTGRISFNPEEINLKKELSATLSLLIQTARNKEIELEEMINSDISVYADKNMLSTIVRNLISNSIKFTNQGGKITIDSDLFDKMVQITVSDTGVGMKQEDIGKLFKLDKNFSTHGTNKEEGTGLGLLLCKEMVEKNGGKIWVESKVGVGSKFIFTIPQNKLVEDKD
jgi:PAS domain S-box-containing protein